MISQFKVSMMIKMMMNFKLFLRFNFRLVKSVTCWFAVPASQNPSMLTMALRRVARPDDVSGIVLFVCI